ncbi:hypothetical protein VNO77_29928 [Canavalia gladiata]|uniref:Uncharacterized protein n=1 Tax=Canavalia gladiata TaxID=3824 RepID=A0AAN9Q6W7_CANGL
MGTFAATVFSNNTSSFSFEIVYFEWIVGWLDGQKMRAKVLPMSSMCALECERTNGVDVAVNQSSIPSLPIRIGIMLYSLREALDLLFEELLENIKAQQWSLDELQL